MPPSTGRKCLWHQMNRWHENSLHYWEDNTVGQVSFIRHIHWTWHIFYTQVNWEMQTVISIYSLEFQQISFPRSPTIVQIILSSVNLHASICKVVVCFHDLWNGTSMIIQCILCIQKVPAFYQNKLPHISETILYFYYWYFAKLLEPNRHFTLKMESNHCDSFISPN